MPTMKKAEAICARAEREVFEGWERMRQYARHDAKMKTRRDVIDVIIKHKPELATEIVDDLPPGRFERLLQGCEKDAHEIACEAGEEASAKASRTELSVAAYEAAYIEAYADALPGLVATTKPAGV